MPPLVTATSLAFTVLFLIVFNLFTG